MVCQYSAIFQSTPPVWGETPHATACGNIFANFNPLPPCGGRPPVLTSTRDSRYFNPLPPCGGRRGGIWQAVQYGGDFNPLPPCGGRLAPCIPTQAWDKISIHSPRVGGDRIAMAPARHVAKFQSTPPVWGETVRIFRVGDIRGISIHSPRVGGDSCGSGRPGSSCNFNPLPPCGGRRADRDGGNEQPYFNPLPPCGGRRSLFERQSPQQNPRFQSTPPVWGETRPGRWTITQLLISIHSPRVGGDDFLGHLFPAIFDFNPLPPCGGRPA